MLGLEMYELKQTSKFQSNQNHYLYNRTQNHIHLKLQQRHGEERKQHPEKQISAYVTRTTNVPFLLNHFVFSTFIASFFFISFSHLAVEFWCVFFSLALPITASFGCQRAKFSLHKGFFFIQRVTSAFHKNRLLLHKII